jgi:hypothetical protein
MIISLDTPPSAFLPVGQSADLNERLKVVSSTQLVPADASNCQRFSYRAKEQGLAQLSMPRIETKFED